MAEKEAKDAKMQAKSMLSALTASGIINPQISVEQLLMATVTLDDEVGVRKTVVYDSDKYFAVMK